MSGEQPAATRQTPAGAGHVVADRGEAAAFLATPASHGPWIDRVERVDTHGAMVFLGGERAYKMKRAVRYPYMDFSSLALRRLRAGSGAQPAHRTGALSRASRGG